MQILDKEQVGFIILILLLLLVTSGCFSPRKNHTIEASYANKSLKISADTKLKYDEAITMFIEKANLYKELEKKDLIKSEKLRKDIQTKLFEIENFKESIDQNYEKIAESAIKKQIALIQETVTSIKKISNHYKPFIEIIGDLEYSITLKSTIDFPREDKLEYWIIILNNNSNTLIENIEGKIEIDPFYFDFKNHLIKADSGIYYENNIFSNKKRKALKVNIINLNPQEEVIFHLLISRENPLAFNKNPFEKIYFRGKGITAKEKK